MSKKAYETLQNSKHFSKQL